MPKAISKNKSLLLAMALALCVSFMSAHPVSADPPANDGKVAVVTLLGDSFSAGNGAGDYYEGYSQPQPTCFDKEFYCLSAVL